MNQNVYDIIDRIAKEHSGKTFGYLTRDDLKNEIWVICLNKLKDFDYTRGELEHFLRTSVKNRLINKFKDITKSVRSPCPRCPFYRPNEEVDCAKFGEEKYQCSKWRNFQLSTQSRNSLLNASEQQFERSDIDDILSKISANEIKSKVLDKISHEYYQDINQLMAGKRISKQRLKKLKKEILRILSYNNDLVNLTVNGSDRK